MIPYPAIVPIVMEPVAEGDVPYTILHPDMPTSLEELQISWIQLKGEWDTFEAQFYEGEKKVLELTKKLHEDRNLNAYITLKRKRPWETWAFSIVLVYFCFFFPILSPRGIL